MLKEATYKKRFEILEPWVNEILNAVKRELKNEHLPRNPAFVQKFFTQKSVNKLTTEEIGAAYFQAIKGGDEEAGEWVTSRWVLKNAEVYNFFAQKLADVNPQFDEIEQLPDARGVALMEEAVAQFGAVTTYAFSILNAVMFSEHVYQELRELATAESSKKQPLVEAIEEKSIEELKTNHAREIRKLTDKYEQKLLGMQKKYTQDVDGLKKQIGQLQRRLAENRSSG